AAAAQAATAIERRHGVQIRRQERARSGVHLARIVGASKYAGDAVAPFPRTRRLRAGKIIATGAGMAVDHAETGGLAPQKGGGARQHDMLVAGGDITGGTRWLIGCLGT